MRKIPMPRRVFDQVYSTFSLRSYCGEASRNEFEIPGSLTNVKAGELIGMFVPGKQAIYREIQAEVVSSDPIAIKVTRLIPEQRASAHGA